MEQRSICLINDSFPPQIDGVANAVCNYADNLIKDGKQAVVVTPYHPKAEDTQFAYPVLRYPSLKTTKKIGYRMGIPYSPSVIDSIQSNSYNLLHSHSPFSALVMARMLRDRLQVPVVFTYHTKFDIDIANAIRGRIIQEETMKILAENISGSDEVWTVSRGAGENLLKLGYEGDYLVMPNGVDLPRGRVSQQQLDEVTGGYDLPGDVPIFLFVGRMMWYKGIRIILDALEKLHLEGCDYRMVFVGGGRNREEILAYTKKLQCYPKLVFVGPVHNREDIRAWYCKADLFLFPSSYDTNGLVVREAAACNLASVLIKNSCPAEDIVDARNGFLIEENADSLAHKLRDLCPLREQMKAIGEQAGEELYLSWEQAVANAEERYEIVIDRYRQGLYPKHKHISDYFLHRAAKSMERVNKVKGIKRKVKKIRSLRRGRKKPIR